MKQLKLLLIGGGDRGNSYIKYLDKCPEKFQLVGLAEPIAEKREYLREKYNVPEDKCFENYAELLSLPKFADIAMICTQDKMHYVPAMMAIEKKYDLLLEKPMAPTPGECFEIADFAKKNGVKVLVCHVLRYTQFYKKVKEIIASGKIGELINVVHTEGVGNVHMSHSFVRGNWRRTDESAPMILAKCCHDTDLLQWLFDKPCTKVQSFGDLTYFRKENAPEGAPKRCTDGCPYKDKCFYYAPDVYKIDTAEVQHFRAIAANKFDPTDEEVDEILKTSPYGRCVYYCDNDVVDHQVVNMQFGDFGHATLTMSAFNKGGRTSLFMGTKGELRADMENQSLEFYDFATRETLELYEADDAFDQSIAGGHGGGDFGIMSDLYEYIANGTVSDSISDVTVSSRSHLICFAAEKSRLQNTVIDMNVFTDSLKK
ncbi:MAG: Gfo/Idh/MocA family oxidoreductase [Clostridia bacterium]|nr:Gfo/Idh/MocA family oxidoreductase [Clostridia bacterium]